MLRIENGVGNLQRIFHAAVTEPLQNSDKQIGPFCDVPSSQFSIARFGKYNTEDAKLEEK